MTGSIKASPFHRRDHSLAGFVLSGRWPESTKEWAQFLAVAVRLTALPGWSRQPPSSAPSKMCRRTPTRHRRHRHRRGTRAG